MEEVEFITSILTKNEIIRELVSGFALKEEEVLKIWNEFLSSLKCSYIQEIKINEDLTEITLKLRMKLRTLINFVHLFVAIDQDAYFLTGDKDLVKIVKENVFMIK
jgi:predicted nucleic acid-binding protein